MPALQRGPLDPRLTLHDRDDDDVDDDDVDDDGVDDDDVDDDDVGDATFAANSPAR